MKKLLLPILLLSTMLVSCEEQTDPKQPLAVEHNGACIIDINQYNTDKNTILTYTDSVYSKDGRYLGTIVHKDTIPTLGSKTETFESEQTVQDADGNDYYKDTTITYLQRYTLYINVSKNAQ